MKIENEKVVKATYDLYIKGDEEGSEEVIERATAENPLVYCHGEGMMLPKFEENLAGMAEGDTFDFVLEPQDAYGERDEEGVITLPKKLFFNADGDFDDERVYEGNVIPMNTTDGQIVNALVLEVAEKEVTIDLNHPYAGEALHFVGKIIEVRAAKPEELEAIRHPHCGGCHGGCHGDCNSDCSGNCNGNCEK